VGEDVHVSDAKRLHQYLLVQELPIVGTHDVLLWKETSQTGDDVSNVVGRWESAAEEVDFSESSDVIKVYDVLVEVAASECETDLIVVVVDGAHEMKEEVVTEASDWTTLGLVDGNSKVSAA
jgi:hypothetical protein